MEKQMIISISREYGSGGHGVANKLGELLGLPVYDKNIMFEIAQEKGVDMSEWDDHEEKPGNRLLYRRVGNYSSNPSDIICIVTPFGVSSMKLHILGLNPLFHGNSEICMFIILPSIASIHSLLTI